MFSKPTVAKSLFLLLMAALLFLTSSCTAGEAQNSASTPEPGSRASLYAAAQATISTIDAFLEGNLTLEEATTAHNNLLATLPPMEEMWAYQDNATSGVGGYLNSLSATLEFLEYAIRVGKVDSEDYDNLYTVRDGLQKIMDDYPVETLTPQQISQLDASQQKIVSLIDDYLAGKLTVQAVYDGITPIIAMYPEPWAATDSNTIIGLRRIHSLYAYLEPYTSPEADIDVPNLEKRMQNAKKDLTKYLAPQSE